MRAMLLALLGLRISAAKNHIVECLGIDARAIDQTARAMAARSSAARHQRPSSQMKRSASETGEDCLRRRTTVPVLRDDRHHTKNSRAVDSRGRWKHALSLELRAFKPSSGSSC